MSGSARVVSDGPIGGILRFEHPDLGVAGVGASPPGPDRQRARGGLASGLSRIQKDLPVDLQLALGHEGKNVKERTKLMRKQDRRLRRILPRGNALNMFMKNLYERPVNVVIQEFLKAQKKEEEKKTDKLPRQSRK